MAGQTWNDTRKGFAAMLRERLGVTAAGHLDLFAERSSKGRRVLRLLKVPVRVSGKPRVRCMADAVLVIGGECDCPLCERTKAATNALYDNASLAGIT